MVRPREEGDDYFTLHQRRQLPKTELGAIFGEDNPTHQDTRPDGARIVVVVVADDHQRFMISTFWKAIPALTSPCTDDDADLAICCAFWFWCFQKRGSALCEQLMEGKWSTGDEHNTYSSIPAGHKAKRNMLTLAHSRTSSGRES